MLAPIRIPLARGAPADVLGVVTSSQEAAEITTRTGKRLTKRDITLTDQTASSIECT